MNKKGIYYHQFIPRNQYEKVGYSPTIFTWATKVRNSIISRIISSDLSSESQEFLCTILLGEKRFISETLKEDFSKVGLSHILALSGLHVAIIIGFLLFLLYPLRFIRLHRLQLIVTLLLLFFYALITGFSPSVTRAVVMAGFGMISVLLYRKNSILNAICGAALLILCIQPNDIFNVSFQLSFVAVISIIVFADYFNPINKKQTTLHNIFAFISVSIAAMLGSGIISMYYFNSFPLLFIFSNIIILPILPFIFIVGIIAIIFPQSFLCYVFNWCFTIIKSIISFIGDVPYSTIQNVYITIPEVILYFTILGTLILWLKVRKRLYLNITIALLIGINILFLIEATKQKPQGAYILNDYNETPILYYNAGIATFAPTINEGYLHDYSIHNHNFLAKNRISDIIIAPNNISDEGFFTIGNKRLVYINHKLKTDHSEFSRIRLNYLIIGSHYYGSIAKLLMRYDPDTIIISGNIYEKRASKLVNECIDLKQPYYNIHKSGAFKFI